MYRLYEPQKGVALAFLELHNHWWEKCCCCRENWPDRHDYILQKIWNSLNVIVFPRVFFCCCLPYFFILIFLEKWLVSTNWVVSKAISLLSPTRSWRNWSHHILFLLKHKAPALMGSSLVLSLCGIIGSKTNKKV